MIILSEVSQTERGECQMMSLNVESKKKKWYKWNLFYKTEVDSQDMENKLMVTKEGAGRGKLGAWD